MLGRELFGIAGVWAEWKNPNTEKWEKTFATFTSEPNGVMQPIHDRQPVILAPADFNEWLSRSERPPVHLLRILPDEEIAMTLLNAEKHNAEEPPMMTLFD